MLQRHWKKIVIGVVALAVLVVGGSFIYAKLFNQADPAFGQTDVIDKLNQTTTTVAAETTVPGTDASTPQSTTGATDAPTTTAAAGVDGTWNLAADSEVGYRVKESINGFDTTANGRTNAVTGSFVIAGTKATEGSWTVDMTTFKSDESRRDNQFNTRIMTVDQFPTSTFVLTSPIDFGSVPADGQTITAKATGDLTLRGTTKSVTFDLQATFQNGRVGVLGQIPIVFADYGIPNPSFATITTEDNGLLEFVLIFDKA
ncbi:MAG: YceI family protein [Ilumatobacteraceae bacterium]